MQMSHGRDEKLQGFPFTIPSTMPQEYRDIFVSCIYQERGSKFGLCLRLTSSFLCTQSGYCRQYNCLYLHHIKIQPLQIDLYFMQSSILN